MVTGWAGERRLQVTSPRGIRTVTADAVVLATGARERPRPARLVPGDRPDGVYTTGQLQNLVHLHHASVGSRALIVGAELVSWSAVLTLREAGCATVGMVSGYPRVGGVRGVPAAGQGADRRAGVDPQPGRRHRRQGPRARRGGGEHRNRQRAPRSTATPWCSPATGSPTTNWPAPAASRWTPRRAGPSSTRPADQQPGVFAVGNLLHPGRHRRRRRAGRSPCGRRGEPVGWNVATSRRRPSASAPRRRFRWVAPQLVSARGRRRGQRRSAVLGRRVPQAAEAAGGAGRQDAGDETHAVARRAGPGVPGAVVAGGRRRPRGRRRHRLLRLILLACGPPRAGDSSAYFSQIRCRYFPSARGRI